LFGFFYRLTAPPISANGHMYRFSPTIIIDSKAQQLSESVAILENQKVGEEEASAIDVVSVAQSNSDSAD
jgi:hypothetical protein